MTAGDVMDFEAGLTTVLARQSPGKITALNRLSGGANLESWSIDFLPDGAAGPVGYVLRRAPSPEWSAARDLGLPDEAQLVRVVNESGVCAPRVVAILTPEDGLGEGYIMDRVEAEVSPAKILADPPASLLSDIARELAGIHAVPLDALPAALPKLDIAEGLAEFRRRFAHYGGDRPVIALALKWCEDHIPAGEAERTLIHGDYRIGNLMVDANGLAAVLDWELAHTGDYHEDLAFGCMTVWRFGVMDKRAFALGDLEDFFAAYEGAGGRKVDRDRFHFWLVYRTLWWALGCLQMSDIWRQGIDTGLERTVISRRTAEQELDLLLLLEADVPEAERQRALPASLPATPPTTGEASAAEILGAVSDWLNSDIKPGKEGRDKFMVAVAMNALGIVRRELEQPVVVSDRALADAILTGRETLATPGLLAQLRRIAIDKLSNDMPKYPALPLARKAWGIAD